MDIKQKLEDNTRIQKESKTKLKYWQARHDELELIQIEYVPHQRIATRMGIYHVYLSAARRMKMTRRKNLSRKKEIRLPSLKTASRP